MYFLYFFLRQNVSVPVVSTSGRAVLYFLYQPFSPYWILLPDLSYEFFWWCPNKGQGESIENYLGLLNANITNFLRIILCKYIFVYFWCGGYTLAKTCAHWPMNRTQVVHFLFLRLFAEFCVRFAFFCARFAQHFGTIPGSFWPTSVDHWPEIGKQLTASYQLSTFATIQNGSIS